MGINPEDEPTHTSPNRRPAAAMSDFKPTNLSVLTTYLDDMGMKSIIEVDEATNEPYRSGVRSGEWLRQEFLRGTAESANLQVVADERSQKKWEKGKCGVKQVALGKEWCLDLDHPTIGVPAPKQQKLAGLVTAAQGQTVTIPHKQLEQLAHKLAEASTVVFRGKLYVQRLFAALKLTTKGGSECYMTN